eukprot:120299-Prorocentrum_minimum.AAC.1
MGIFSLPFCDWCPLCAYSLPCCDWYARYGFILPRASPPPAHPRCSGRCSHLTDGVRGGGIYPRIGPMA